MNVKRATASVVASCALLTPSQAIAEPALHPARIRVRTPPLSDADAILAGQSVLNNFRAVCHPPNHRTPLIGDAASGIGASRRINSKTYWIYVFCWGPARLNRRGDPVLWFRYTEEYNIVSTAKHGVVWIAGDFSDTYWRQEEQARSGLVDVGGGEIGGR